MPCPSEEIDFTGLRARMVEQQLLARGITNADVLRAMKSIPREAFVPEDYKNEAYSDGPLPIGSGQTISQPYMVALMTELLNIGPGDKVLEIGTGSGYQAAILSAITSNTFSIERIESISQQAHKALCATGCESVTLLTGDGSLGCPEESPFNAIIVTSGAPDIPVQLKLQLSEGGRLVIPIGNRTMQTLFCITRKKDDYIMTKHGNCVFVPLIGVAGWSKAI